MKYYIGIDGGGTKTTALLADETGAIVRSVCGKGVNYNAIGMEAARTNLKTVIDTLLQNNYITVSAAAIGCAALGGKADAQTTAALCEGIVPCSNILLDSDVFIALSAAPEAAPKAVAICGTGSMCAGLLPDGTRRTAGGWGYLLGDEGSGYAVAVEAVRAALRAQEGIIPETALASAVLQYFNIPKMNNAIDLFYSGVVTRDTIAGFAPLVFTCAEAGDPAAADVIRNQAAAFAQTAASLLYRMPLGTPLYLWGGIFEHHAAFRTLFTEELHKTHPHTLPALLPVSPEQGAVFAAMQTEKING